MSEKTKSMLVDLGANPDLVEEFKKDPESVMKRYGVPADHRQLILDGDKEGLAKAADLDDEHVQLLIV